MTSLAQIRAKLLEQETKSQQNKSTGVVSATYPFWNLAEGNTSTLRFLPDADESNIFFWKERQMIRIPFSGTDQDPNKQTSVTVPCVETWGESCPIHAEIRPWFKDPSLEDIARKYWKKRSYLFQGFVVEDGIKGEEQPENPIRRFIISPSLFNNIKGALMDPDFPEIPTDYEQGTDFKIVKTQKGQYADYSTSNWLRRERSLNDIERQAIETHGLFDLNTWMPEKPTSKHLQVITDMFEASVEGEVFRGEWAEYYKPFNYEVSGGDSISKPQSESITTEAPVTSPPPSSNGNSAEDILATIRARKAS